MHRCAQRGHAIWVPRVDIRPGGDQGFRDFKSPSVPDFANFPLDVRPAKVNTHLPEFALSPINGSDGELLYRPVQWGFASSWAQYRVPWGCDLPDLGSDVRASRDQKPYCLYIGG